MLSILKNALVTGVSKETVIIRKRELDWFTHNYWIIATQSTVIAGFSFQQLTSEIPNKTSDLLTTAYITLTATALGSSLYVIVRASLSCMLAPGLALRGPAGFQSMTRAIATLRKEQDRILWCFMLGLTCFVFSSFMVVVIFGKSKRTAIRVEAVMLFVVLLMIVFAWRITLRFYHDRAAGSGVQAIEQTFTAVGDLDSITHPPVS